ncbi:MAG: TIGR03087 family PEP-CTERM/XrtA system glycosyltransferase [Sedimentisphaerales bacterium]|nr:TIGR03087 family PEP-CTERM/XrtA system glycosyltransferase [Sedimentisphaerales bacterium]
MKRLLFITHRVPFPPDKGERVRAYNQIRALAEHYHITLATPVHDSRDEDAAQLMRRWCKHVLLAPADGRKGRVRGGLAALMTGTSVTERHFHSACLAKLIEKEAKRKPFDLVMASSSAMVHYLRHAGHCPRIMDLVDVDSAKWSSYAEKAGWPKRWLYQREARLVRQLEEDAIVHCNAVLLVSEAESQVLGVYPGKVHALSNGVDVDYFQPSRSTQSVKGSLVFTGTMDYEPNIDGVCWFVNEIWPELRKQYPEATFTIVGRNPSRAVKRLEHAPGVKVTGSVPDVRPYLRTAMAAVCPLRIARGIQNKVLEAMAMGLPVVASGPALEGLETQPGKDVLQADTPEQWQSRLGQLFDDEAYRAAIAEQSRQCVVEHYAWSARVAPLVELCKQLTDVQEQTVSATAPTADKKMDKRRCAHPSRAGTKQPAVLPMFPQRARIKWYIAAPIWVLALAYMFVLVKVNKFHEGQYLPYFGIWNSGLTPEMQNILHMPAMALMMVLVSLALSTVLRRRLWVVLLSLAICIAAAFILEKMQGGVAGRQNRLSDVLIGVTGIALGLPGAMAWRWPHYHDPK